MYVLAVIDSLAPGGAERSLAALAPYYVSAGVKLDVAYLKERHGVRSELEAAGAQVFGPDGASGRLAWVRWLRRLARTLEPDLIHTSVFEADITGRVAAALSGTTVVSSLVNEAYGPAQLGDPALSTLKVRGAQLTDAITARAVARFHAVTGDIAARMSRRLRIPRSRIDVVPRGRDPRSLGERTAQRRASARAVVGAAAEDFVLLAAARQSHQKGLDVLVEAMPAVLRGFPRAKLLVAGREGPATVGLRTRAEGLQLGRSVRWLGHRTDVPDLLCAADVVVLPSRWEGMPGVVLEAMALEAPVVATDLAGVREVTDDGRLARLVASEDADALAEAIIGTLSDAGAAGRVARDARAYFLERFTVERAAKGMIAFYERALSSRRRRP